MGKRHHKAKRPTRADIPRGPVPCRPGCGGAREGEGFWEGVRRRGMFPLPTVLLAFPTVTVTLASVGFLFGVGVSGWYGVAGFLAAAALAVIGGGTLREGFRRAGWFALTVAAIFALDQSFVLFSWWDAQAYHLPAARFLLEGWNPVFAATRETLLAATGADPATFNAYHVAYLPRAGWVWSAVTAALTGNLESGDTLILLTGAALGGLAWRATPPLFGAERWKRLFFASLTMLSPGVVASAFCGAQDGSLYALLMIFLLAACAYRRTGRTSWLGTLAIAPVLGCNLKFTGLVSLVLSAAVFTVPLLWAALRRRGGGAQGALPKAARTFWKWVAACGVGFGLALAVGFSPYLTNWANHGGPFYPEHSFSKTEPLPAMTADFDLLNDDAAAMGYVGRVVNAYFSKWLAHRYYEWKLGHKPFRPVFHLDQVNGLGTVFRIVMCLTLLTLCLTRRCAVPWLLAALLLTSFLQPARTVGYVRYVPQLWMFPVLVAFNAMTVNVPRSPWVGRTLGVTTTAILASCTYVFALGKLILAFGMSAYALSIVQTMREEAAPRAYILSLHDRYREDGRCLAAWETLPPDIPAPHVFDTYYRTILPESGVRAIDWQSPAGMRDLRAAGEPCFYLGEHLWFWPRDPARIRHPGMHFYAGHPRKPFTASNVLRIAADVLPDLPAYLWRVARFRWEQVARQSRAGSRWQVAGSRWLAHKVKATVGGGAQRAGGAAEPLKGEVHEAEPAIGGAAQVAEGVEASRKGAICGSKHTGQPLAPRTAPKPNLHTSCTCHLSGFAAPPATCHLRGSAALPATCYLLPERSS